MKHIQPDVGIQTKYFKMNNNREIILKLKNVRTYFPVRKGIFKKTVGHIKAVDGVNLEIYRGETLGLVGESGCGKTTLGKSILQLVKATEGEIIYNGQVINDMPPNERAKLGLFLSFLKSGLSVPYFFIALICDFVPYPLFLLNK